MHPKQRDVTGRDGPKRHPKCTPKQREVTGCDGPLPRPLRPVTSLCSGVHFGCLFGAALAVASCDALQSPRFSTQEGVSVRYLGAISRTSRSSSRTTFSRVLMGFKRGSRSEEVCPNGVFFSVCVGRGVGRHKKFPSSSCPPSSPRGRVHRMAPYWCIMRARPWGVTPGGPRAKWRLRPGAAAGWARPSPRKPPRPDTSPCFVWNSL